MKASEIIKKFKSAKFKARHGDVVIISDGAVKGSCDAPRRLAEGEVTGHAHRILGAESDAQVQKIANETVQRLLKVSAAQALLDHEEHKTNAIPKGTHRSSIQATWTPEGLRRVED
jgi:hypothetical protein